MFVVCRSEVRKILKVLQDKFVAACEHRPETQSSRPQISNPEERKELREKKVQIAEETGKYRD